MRHEVRPVPVPATGQNGAAVKIDDLEDVMVRVDGTGAGTFSLKVQGKLSGPGDQANDTWVDISGAITGTAIVPFDRVTTPAVTTCGYSLPFTHVRIAATTTDSTPAKVSVAGRNARTK